MSKQKSPPAVREPDEVKQRRSDVLYNQILHPKKRAFLAAYAHGGRIRQAALDAQIPFTQHYFWLKQDEFYVAAFEQAKELAADYLEDEAVRRAVNGVQRAVYHKGDVVGEETIYSDTLLIFMLKGLRPEKYRENSHVKVESEVQVNISIEARTREAHERLLRLRHASGSDDAFGS